MAGARFHREGAEHRTRTDGASKVARHSTRTRLSPCRCRPRWVPSFPASQGKGSFAIIAAPPQQRSTHTILRPSYACADLLRGRLGRLVQSILPVFPDLTAPLTALFPAARAVFTALTAPLATDFPAAKAPLAALVNRLFFFFPFSSNLQPPSSYPSAQGVLLVRAQLRARQGALAAAQDGPRADPRHRHARHRLRHVLHRRHRGGAIGAHYRGVRCPL